MVIIDVKNPAWANEQHTAIICDVKFKDSSEYEQFGMFYDGDDTHDIYIKCVNGDFGKIADYVEPTIPEIEPIVILNPVEKLKQFLASNPDVADILK